jgi:signal transduction histidine kinase
MVTARARPKLIVAVNSDEAAQLEAALQRNEKLALAGRIAASVMHEINNPAEAIANLTYLISHNASDPEMVISLAGQIEQQLLRIQYVTRQTLSFFREIPSRQRTDLVTVVETALRFHERSLLQKKVHVRTQLPASLIATIYPGNFLQLVSNLLGNAIEAVEEGGLLCIRLRRSAGLIRFTVSDNGCGIPNPLRAHLFEPFQSTKAERGNGLGLWICKSVAEKHGGHISWRSSTSKKRHGTTFLVFLGC